MLFPVRVYFGARVWPDDVKDNEVCEMGKLVVFGNGVGEGEVDGGLRRRGRRQ